MNAPHGSSQRLRRLPGRFGVEHHPAGAAPPAGDDWLALVRGPDGLTVVREVGDASEDAWVALYSGDTPHAPDATGMLSALVAPLAEAGIPVLVTSTYQADIVLVPEPDADAAVGALRRSGHHVGD